MGCLSAIFLYPEKGGPSVRVNSAQVLAGKGLVGDHERSPGRQITLISVEGFTGAQHTWGESRRNLAVGEIELPSLIGKEFRVGEVFMRGVKYCSPCDLPDKLSGKKGFRTHFHERGGLIAKTISDGEIKVGDTITDK
jgi:MOSC domain-containing protein YiiM